MSNNSSNSNSSTILTGIKEVGHKVFGGYAELLRIPHTARYSIGSVIACMPFPMVGMTITISVQHYYGNYSLAGMLTAIQAIALAVATPLLGKLTDKFGVLYIGSDILTNPNNVKLYANSSSSLSVESNITGQIEDIIEAEKLKSYNIENLSQILQEVKTRVGMQTFRNDESQEEEAHAKSSVVATGTGFVLGMILYMFLLIYGSMVMQSVIEEKNSRVLEVMVSSVRPFDLMLGKILGVASVAVVQVLIWGALCVVGALAVAQMMPPEMMEGVQAMQQGVPGAAAAIDVNPEMLQVIAAITDFGFILRIFAYLLLFVFGGYLFYSAMFAAVGSAVDSIQDAQQLQTPITIPIILALLVMISVVNDPNSQMAFWFSMIPFTSPVVMMARIPYGIPLWEVILSLAILYASFTAMVWLAAKIYRVGIFMYGKKPTFKELYKWMRYKY